MAAPFQPRELYDGINALPAGINSGVAALLLQRNQCSFAINTTFRGSYATDRPPVDKLTITWPSDEVQAAVEQGLFQGAGFYRPDSGTSSLFAAISGRLFQFQLIGDGVTVTERTIPGDPQSATATQHWLWQSEIWMIWNDGINLPVFVDPSTSRRSDGGSQLLELTAVDWVIPDIGSSVLVTLGSPYTGPFNRPIYVDDVLYQAVENANASYNVTLTNLTATPGGTIPIGQEVTSEPAKLGEIVSNPISISILSGSIPVGTFFDAINISYPYTGPTGIDLLINGRVWRIFDVLNGRVDSRLVQFI